MFTAEHCVNFGAWILELHNTIFNIPTRFEAHSQHRIRDSNYWIGQEVFCWLNIVFDEVLSQTSYLSKYHVKHRVWKSRVYIYT